MSCSPSGSSIAVEGSQCRASDDCRGRHRRGTALSAIAVPVEALIRITGDARKSMWAPSRLASHWLVDERWSSRSSARALRVPPAIQQRGPVMNRKLLLTPFVLGAVFVASRLLTPKGRRSLSRLPATMMKRCMEHMPEDSPPKILTSGMRRVQMQNDEILALLREQNELLRRSGPPGPQPLRGNANRERNRASPDPG
jgi:hypothetical protein